MLNYYGLIATNIFLAYFFIMILAFLPKKYKFIITLILIAISNLIPIVNNLTIAELAFGYIGYLSLCSTLFILIIITTKLYSKQAVIFSYTCLAFLIMCIIFYGCFFISSYKLYDIGFSAYIVLLFIFSYGIILLLISNKFIVFNTILLIATLASFSNLLQMNIWNYIIDPILVIICLIELISALIILVKNKKENIAEIKYF